jgi:dipeptidyl aminopeptidase/acylaminoacyl peptidase
MHKIASLVVFLLVCLTLKAQENLTYQKPSPEILALADYERAPSVMMDSDAEYMVFSYRPTYKTLQDLAVEDMRLGGLRIDPVTHISSTVTYINNLKVRKTTDAVETQVKGLPANPRITFVSFSPDETRVAFTNTTATGVELWVLDLATATAKRLTDAVLNATMGTPYTWFDKGQTLLVRMLPQNAPALIDPKKTMPAGPVASVSDGSKSQNRTYQDLLKNPTDEANFEALVTSELVKVNVSGKMEKFKPAAMYAGESMSPDGNYVMITTVHKPFSYIVPMSRFPQKSVVYDKNGKEIKVVNEVPLTEIMPKGFSSVRKGKRSMMWRADKPAQLAYAVALDEGDQANKVDFRDEVFLWDAPFAKEPVSMMKTRQRFAGITWANDTLAVVMDTWYDTRNQKTYFVDPSKPGREPRIVSDRNYQDIYSDPGNPETVKNQYGRYVLLIENNQAFLMGEGHTPEGQFPFIDALDLGTLKTTRLYQSAYTDKKEDLISMLDAKKGEVLVQIQSKNEFPNYYKRNLRAKMAPIPLTNFKNPFESIANVHKEVIKYKRKDGVELSGTLYLPVGYDKTKKEKLPLLIWAYPEEFKDKNSAGQSAQNPNEFTFPYYGSFVYWVTKGYVVLDDASFPIVGEGTTEPNDNFIEQLVSNAEAAIDAVDALGYIDRKRVAVGGHSYGAFMTANLLTHSNLFACGIARSGAYNRTLTPFGFQSEQRNYWDVPGVYNTMSPFMNADKMKTPMLLVHGEADHNPGTFTLQTERYFQALKGLGAPARMVILPKESHSYVAKENIFHLLWEQDQFLEKYLKNGTPR